MLFLTICVPSKGAMSYYCLNMNNVTLNPNCKVFRVKGDAFRVGSL